MRLPDGFERVERNGAVVVVRHGLADRLLAAGVDDPEGLIARSPSDHEGRTRLARIDLGAEGPMLVRALSRGGLLGKLVRRVSFDPWRSLAELVVSAEAEARGARVLDVVAAITRRRGVGYTHGLVSREVTGALDLLAALRSERGEARSAALSAAGAAIRRLHDAGVDHVDLNVKNVLLRPDGEALVIDLDRCRIGAGALPSAVREQNLVRLYRSWTKLALSEPEAVDEDDPLAVARAYAGDDDALLERLIAAGRGARFGLRKLRWKLTGASYP